MDAVLSGFAVVLEPENLLYCLLGVVIGMLIGVLPGLGPAATIAILLPVTFALEPVTAIIMLAGIFYGAQYGGTITSVLLRLPGEASSVVTVFDGNALARQGRAGTALGIAAIGSFAGGTLSVVALSLVAPFVAGFALDFGPPEYTALALLGILLVATIGSGGRVKALAAACVGLLLATVGRDGFTGAERFTFDHLSLADGLDFVPIAMGLFGLGEILHSLEERHRAGTAPPRVANVWPARADLRQSRGAIGRGSVIGFGLGVLPGGGAVLASLAAYAVEKRRSAQPERFGRGAVEGVAAPESANNAAATSSFIPLLTLGIPANATMAVIFGALLIQGVTPGPQLVTENPELFWGVINSMYLGNVLLLIMSIPLVGLFVRILRVRPAILAPVTVLITLIGAYTVNHSTFDIALVIAFGVLGYLMKKLGFEPGPLVLAFVLGSLLESSLRRSSTATRRSSSPARSPAPCWCCSWRCWSGRRCARCGAAAGRTRTSRTSRSRGSAADRRPASRGSRRAAARRWPWARRRKSRRDSAAVAGPTQRFVPFRRIAEGIVRHVGPGRRKREFAAIAPGDRSRRRAVPPTPKRSGKY